MTVRQLYYRAEVEGLPGIDKTESGYDKIQRQVLLLRRTGLLPYRHIADLTRWMRQPTTFDSVEEALQETARLYRKALWRDADVYVEIWCEKDALAGVIYPVTALYDVPLMVARGFSSETFASRRSRRVSTMIEHTSSITLATSTAPGATPPRARREA